MHFTYGEVCDNNTLKQGDILKKTPELNNVLEEYHSYFSKDQYTHFLVLTQTCDLVLRKGDYKARYITIAAIRSLKDTIAKQLVGLQTAQVQSADLYYSDSHRQKLIEFLRKLHNNNDTDHFFLKASPKHGLTNDSCAFLQLSVPIKTLEHYKTCCEAKCLELKDGFRAKLGYLVGDLYSRVGTDDYMPTAIPDLPAFDAHLENTLSAYVKMVPGVKFSKFQQYAQAGLALEDINRKIVEENKQSKDNRLNGIVRLIKKVVEVSPEQEAMLRNSFAQDPTLKSFIEK